jgi:hypothetical protein
VKPWASSLSPISSCVINEDKKMTFLAVRVYQTALINVGKNVRAEIK